MKNCTYPAFIAPVKFCWVMRLTIVLLLIATFHAGAAGFARRDHFNGKSVSPPQLFDVIKQQTGYDFMYAKSLLENTRPVDVHYNKTSLKTVLDDCLAPAGP